MKKGLLLFIFISSIFMGKAQENGFDFQIGTKVSISDNTKKGIPNVYMYNEAYKTGNKFRFKPISGQLSSKSDLLGRVFTIEKIIEGRFEYNRLLVLIDETDTLFYDYRIGIENQLIELENSTNTNSNDQGKQENKSEIIREIDAGKFRPNYPDGVYMSLESFNLKAPQRAVLIPVERKGRQVTKIDTLPDICDFFYESSNDVVSRCFAVSFHGYLYFRAGAVLENKSKNDKNQSVKEFNTFFRVLMGGKQFLYSEFEFAYSKSNVYGFQNTRFEQKGVVWNVKKHEFDIFNSCKNYNIFLEEEGGKSRTDCKKGELPNLDEVRAFIKHIM